MNASTISEVISALQEILNQHGDLKVCYDYGVPVIASDIAVVEEQPEPFVNIAG